MTISGLIEVKHQISILAPHVFFGCEANGRKDVDARTSPGKGFL